MITQKGKGDALMDDDENVEMQQGDVDTEREVVVMAMDMD